MKCRHVFVAEEAAVFIEAFTAREKAIAENKAMAEAESKADDDDDDEAEMVEEPPSPDDDVEDSDD